MAQHSSAFSQAVEEFATRPTKKKKSFVQRMWEEKLIISPEEVQESLLEFHQDNSQRAARKVLRPVFDALRDYDRVMDVLGKPFMTLYGRACIDSQNYKVSADPMPSAFIWGGLKAVIIVSLSRHVVVDLIYSLLVADGYFSVSNGIMNYLNDSRIK